MIPKASRPALRATKRNSSDQYNISCLSSMISDYVLRLSGAVHKGTKWNRRNYAPFAASQDNFPTDLRFKLSAAVINLRPSMRPSDNALVCSKIMTTIKIVASISLLCKDEYAQALCHALP